MSGEDLSAVSAALARLEHIFPFDGYVEHGRDATRVVCEVVNTVLYPPARILDFGAGPCDKTAALSMLGYECVALDDLSDPWHLEGDSRERIVSFARTTGVQLHVSSSLAVVAEQSPFDMVMSHAVLEHLHDSPRELCESLLRLVRPGGYVFFTVPNAVNIRKRLDVVRGRTNYPPYRGYFLSEGPWRGHVREYTRGDLTALAELLDIEIVELRSFHGMLDRMPRRLTPLLGAYKMLTAVAPGLRDTWLLLARRRDGSAHHHAPPPTR